jgi:transposase
VEGAGDVLYPRCAGLDAHKDTVVAGIRLAADGPAKTKVRTFDTTTPGWLALSSWLAETGCTHVATEATGVYWKPVWPILADGDLTLILANAAHVKNVPGRKTDVADALWLAELLAHGLIRASSVPEAATQERRALLRTRKQPVREQASHVQRLQKTLEDANLGTHRASAMGARSNLARWLKTTLVQCAWAELAKVPTAQRLEGQRRAPVTERTATCGRSSSACATGAAPRRRSAPSPPRS